MSDKPEPPGDWDGDITKPEVRTEDEEQRIIDAWMAIGRQRTTRQLRPITVDTKPKNEYCVIRGQQLINL
jgi:hypothetical protein